MNFKRQLFALCTAALCAPVFANNDVLYAHAGVVHSDDADRGWGSFTSQVAFNKTSPAQIPGPVTADRKIAAWPSGMSVVFKDADVEVHSYC